MNDYVVDISNSNNVEKENNKTVENLLEEYTTLLKKIEDYDNSNISLVFLCTFAIVALIVKSNSSLFICLIILILWASCFVYYIFSSVQKYSETKEETQKMKIKLLTALKQEKFIIEHNRDCTLYSREALLYYARQNRAFYIEEEVKLYAQEILLKHPDIQRIVERETTYEFLKIHSKYQDVINKLCKEKESTKIIYESQ